MLPSIVKRSKVFLLHSMNIRLKEITTLVIGLVCCIPLASADDTLDSLDSASHPKVKSRQHIPLPTRRIDSLTINHDDDPGNLHIEKLLAKQFSPLRMQLENNINADVQSYIDKFAGNNYRFHLSKMLGLSQYYFPIFEKAFLETGVPLEIKYLAIIESSLNPQAVSRVGATGPWQFMYATAKDHGLAINSYIDERKDPTAASYAAAEYLKEAFDYYQDWLLAIASYNCGRGNVNKAIQRSGLSNPSFWEIRNFLPTETKNYIPAFIAMHHVLENHEQFGIEPDAVSLATKTEVIMVDRQISLTAIADALSLNEDTILDLNPAYKRKIVKGSKSDLQKLIVPVVDKASYSALYAALQGEHTRASILSIELASNKNSADKKTLQHSIRKGETLEKIAQKYDVTVQDLKAWNRLRNHIIVPGQRLKVERSERVLAVKNSTKTQYITYKVKKGDTLSGIAQRYKISNVKTLKAMNDLKSNQLQPGMTLKVSNL